MNRAPVAPESVRGMHAVRLAQTAAERAAVYRLRYDVYIEEMGKQSAGADDATRCLLDNLDPYSDQLFVAEGGVVVGALRRTFATPSAGDAFGAAAPFLELDRFAVGEVSISLSSRFVIDPDWRNSWVASALVIAAYARARERHVAYDFLTTNANLVPLYERLGYRRYTSSYCAPDVGMLVPMVLVGADHEYLTSVKSPYMHVAQHLSADTRYTERLVNAFPVVADYYRDRMSGAPERCGAGAPACRVINTALKDLGLSESIIRLLGNVGFVHHFRTGSLLARPGDLAHAAFLVLDGDVRAALPEDGGDMLVPGRLHGGECLTHPYCSRTRVTCAADSRVLVLPGETLRALTSRSPETQAAFHAAFSETAPRQCGSEIAA